MHQDFLKLTDRLGTAFKGGGPKFDLFFNTSAKIYRDVYNGVAYEQDAMKAQIEEELRVLAQACIGLSDWSAKKVELSIALDVMQEFRPMINSINPSWPQDWKNAIYRNVGNIVLYAIRRRANLDNPPSPNLSIVA